MLLLVSSQIWIVLSENLEYPLQQLRVGVVTIRILPWLITRLGSANFYLRNGFLGFFLFLLILGFFSLEVAVVG